MFPESHVGGVVSFVDVWLVETVFVHLTEHPAVMVTVLGVNPKLNMLTDSTQGTDVVLCEVARPWELTGIPDANAVVSSHPHSGTTKAGRYRRRRAGALMAYRSLSRS
jgi:hypothetical protein